MNRSRWLFPWGAVVLASLVAGVGIGLVLPHFRLYREGSTLFRQLVKDTGPDNSDIRHRAVLAVRLQEQFSGVQVMRTDPAPSGDITGHVQQAFSIVIMTPSLSLPPGKAYGEDLLDELERYLKEISGAKMHEGVKTKTTKMNDKDTDWIRFGTTETNTFHFLTDCKKNGFWFSYRSHDGAGQIRVHLIDDMHVSAVMDVLE